jgi:hypothetical protein
MAAESGHEWKYPWITLPYAGIIRIRYKGLPVFKTGSQPKLPQRYYSMFSVAKAHQ